METAALNQVIIAALNGAGPMTQATGGVGPTMITATAETAVGLAIETEIAAIVSITIDNTIAKIGHATGSRSASAIEIE